MGFLRKFSIIISFFIITFFVRGESHIKIKISLDKKNSKYKNNKIKCEGVKGWMENHKKILKRISLSLNIYISFFYNTFFFCIFCIVDFQKKKEYIFLFCFVLLRKLVNWDSITLLWGSLESNFLKLS